MIELTPDQRDAIQSGDNRVHDTATNETYVLVREESYARLKALAYDDGPWSDEEMDLLAEEAGELLDRYRP